jgi:hypothetical protein
MTGGVSVHLSQVADLHARARVDADRRVALGKHLVALEQRIADVKAAAGIGWPPPALSGVAWRVLRLLIFA